MEKKYAVHPVTKDVYEVVKFESNDTKPDAIYNVKPGYRGFLVCDCPARCTCRHIRMVARYIRGDRRPFFDEDIARSKSVLEKLPRGQKSLF